MVLRVGIPEAVNEHRRTLLAAHLQRAAVSASPLQAIGVALWWQDLAVEHSINTVAVEAAGPGSVVLIDGLRSAPDKVLARIGSESGPTRLVFCDIASTEGRRLGAVVEPLDITGTLWAQGLTVTDVDRQPIVTGRGTWNVVVGTARRTPTRLS